MSDYGVGEKKIVFNDTDKRHADLKIRLQHDDLTQSEFFRAMITGYISKDARIVSFVHDWRSMNKGYSKVKTAKSKRLLEKGEDIKSKLCLDHDEIDNILCILEQEQPDL